MKASLTQSHFPFQYQIGLRRLHRREQPIEPSQDDLLQKQVGGGVGREVGHVVDHPPPNCLIDLPHDPI